MEINMMYYGCSSPYVPKVYRQHFDAMRDMGVDSVNLNFLEGSLFGFKFVADIAHQSGLRVYGMPGRVAGLFAAGPRPSSVFTLYNPDALMVDRSGKPVIGHSGLLACVNQPKFQDWFYPFMAEAAGAADGILFDEPKSLDEPCYCAICRRLTGSDEEDALRVCHRDSMARMMGTVARAARSQSPGKTSGVMFMPITSGECTARCAAEPGLDYIGIDGPLCHQSVIKESLYDSFPRFHQAARKAGKPLMALVETFCVSRDAHAELERNLRSFGELEAEIYSFNFYPHEVEAPDELMAIVEKTARGLSGR